MFKNEEGVHFGQSSEEGGRTQTTRGARTRTRTSVGIVGCSANTAGRSSSVLLDLISGFIFFNCAKEGEVIQ